VSTIRQIIHEAAGKCPVLGVDIKAAVDVYPALVSVGAIDDGDLAIVVDGAQQRLRVLKGPDSILKEIVCSTAADGFGNTTAVKAHGTTSTGLLKIGQIVGEGQPVGMEFKKLAPTGDIHKPAESGNHAAMTTRILTLKGLQAENESASYRGIYIHGTNREQQLGRRASGGCVRVSNADVMWLAENIPPSTPVYILGDPITTNPAFPSSDDCKPARAERQMSKERPKGDVSKKVPNKMKETAQPKISISEIRKMIRTELIREMQEEPVDLAYIVNIDDLPTDMVDEVAPDDLEVLTALQERKVRSNRSSNKSLKTEGLLDDISAGATLVGNIVGMGYDALKGTEIGAALGLDKKTQSGLSVADMEKLIGTSGNTFSNIADSTKQFLDNLHADESQPSAVDSPELADLPVRTGARVEYAPSVQLSSNGKQFLEKMSLNLDASIPIYVTSANRNPGQQASAMFTKWVLGGDYEISSVYSTQISRSFLAVIDKFRSAGKSDSEIARQPRVVVPILARMVKDMQASGQGFTGSHLAGNAIDLRISGLSDSQIVKLEDAAENAGGKVLIEKNPPHMHIEI